MNVNDIQRHVMAVISEWVKVEKTPISQRVIVEQIMNEVVIPSSTVKAAVRILVKKGFIRKTSEMCREVRYVQLRTL